MTTLAPEKMKVTYTTSIADMERIHELFEEGLQKIKSEAGRLHPVYINGKALKSDKPPISDFSPIDTGYLLGKFTSATAKQVDQTIDAAAKAKTKWAATPWAERVAVVHKAAGLIRRRKFELAALMSLEVGKSRLESLGDAEEAADLLDYYCWQMENADGFVQKMNKITPIEENTDILRPFGVFVCISPFNFPLALACGMTSATLVAGNTLVFKPARDAPWTGLKLYEIYREAGIPADVIQFVSGRGSDIGDRLWQNPKVDGFVFTGSKEVGLHVFRGFSKNFVKPCLMELGGKNAAIVMDTADVDAAAEGICKSAWGLQNQKCSACSRVYAHKKVIKPLIEKIIAWTQKMKMGDPTERDVFFGPVINEAAVKTFEKCCKQAKRDGKILLGGHRLKGGIFDKGWFCAPTVVKAPVKSSLFMEEFFVPFLVVGEITTVQQGVEEVNKADYGLTGGIFSGKEEEVRYFFDHMHTGVLYANKRTGATTGAWPGAQPFCGWKGSGSTGKGGCGPYYVQQFMREQTRCVIREK